MRKVILGGGIAGLALAHFYRGESVVLEKQDRVGGLCRSYDLNGIAYDIGPHILFSKNKEILQKHISMTPTNKIRRSNRIFYKGRYVKYPFENELSALAPEERDYCLETFLNNPYEDYVPKNMLQFFLKTFGEGITQTYLQPYNEKIWKFDPAFLDTQMVERIPKPPKEDIIRSAKGENTEGYLHQLHFYYPSQGGVQSLVDAYASDLERSKRAKVHTGVDIQSITRLSNGHWKVDTNQGAFHSDELLNCLPLMELFRYLNPPSEVKEAVSRLRYNSIAIVVVQLKKDNLGDHFAIMIPDKDVLFHRLTKLNFLGEAYQLPNGGTTLLLEVTYRPGSALAKLEDSELQARCHQDLERIGFAKQADITDAVVRRFKYAYVVYDLDHRQNTDRVLAWLKSQKIRCCGRFAEMEYLNSDAVAARAQALAATLSV